MFSLNRKFKRNNLVIFSKSVHFLLVRVLRWQSSTLWCRTHWYRYIAHIPQELDLHQHQWEKLKTYIDLDTVTSFMKQQFIVTHTICKTAIPALLDSWVTNTLLSKYHVHKDCFTLYFRKNVTCLSVGLLRICQVFSVFCKTVSVGYDKLLFHEQYIHVYVALCTELDMSGCRAPACMWFRRCMLSRAAIKRSFPPLNRIQKN
jgi:hypothetical protein